MTRHPLRRENRFDVDGGLLDVIAPGVELVFLCTPNNPTGRLVDGALLRAAAEQCRAVGAVLAVDECFLPLSDGAGPGLAPCLAEHPNLLLLRAFTKSYAMAGLRLGYALSANGGLLERMAAAGPPWSVSTPAQAAGLAALEQCPDWPGKARALLASERPALSDGLCALGLEVVPGQANYLLFRAAGAADLKERMLMRGVLIRSCANYHGLGNDWYRVCVGQAEQNRRLLAALREPPPTRASPCWRRGCAASLPRTAIRWPPSNPRTWPSTPPSPPTASRWAGPRWCSLRRRGWPPTCG